MILKELLKIKQLNPDAALALVEAKRPMHMNGVDVLNLTVGEIRDRFTKPEEKAFIKAFAALNGVHNGDLTQEIL